MCIKKFLVVSRGNTLKSSKEFPFLLKFSEMKSNWLQLSTGTQENENQ